MVVYRERLFALSVTFVGWQPYPVIEKRMFHVEHFQAIHEKLLVHLREQDGFY